MSVDLADKKKDGKRVGRKLAAVNQALCVACGCCERECPAGAILVYRGVHARVDAGRCVGCGRCASVCPADVIAIARREAGA